MSSPASDEQIEALSNRLLDYPQSTIAEAVRRVTESWHPSARPVWRDRRHPLPTCSRRPPRLAQGASPDMKRFLFAQEQLAAQGKARTRHWPKNKGRCAPCQPPTPGQLSTHQETSPAAFELTAPSFPRCACAAAHTCRSRSPSSGHRSPTST